MFAFVRFVVLLAILLLLGCERPIIGSVEFGFNNLSTEELWVESATYLKADVGCGSLGPGPEYKSILIHRRNDAPAEMVIEWWQTGSHKRPATAELIFNQKVALPDFDTEATKWYIYLTFGKDGKWSVKQIE